MSGQPSRSKEDSQPNETRNYPKGSGVPPIVSTEPRSSTLKRPYARSSASGRQKDDYDRSRFSSGYAASSKNSQLIRRIGQPYLKDLPSKPLRDRFTSRPTASKETPTGKKQYPKPKPEDMEDVVVSLPPECRGFHPSARTNRSRFIKSERDRLNSSEVRVHHYKLRIGTVCFTLQPRLPPISASSSFVPPKAPLDEDCSDAVDRTSALEHRSHWRHSIHIDASSSTSHSPSRDSLRAMTTHTIGEGAGGGESHKDYKDASVIHRPSLDHPKPSTTALNALRRFRSGVHSIQSTQVVKSEPISTSVRHFTLASTPGMLNADQPVITEMSLSQPTLYDGQHPSLDSKPSKSIVRSSPLSDITVVEPQSNPLPDPSISRPISVEQDYGPYETVGKRMRFPSDARDSLRRIVSSPSLSMIFCISMYGAIHEVTCQNPRRQREVRESPSASIVVEDACFLSSPNDDVLILGQNDDHHPLSAMRLTDSPSIASTTLPRPKSQVGPFAGSKGVSCVSSVPQPQSFVTGGFDRVVHYWSLDRECHSALPIRLSVTHNSAINSLLAINDSGQKLLTGSADRSISLWDFVQDCSVQRLHLSAPVSHLHMTSHSQSILVELSSIGRQFEMRDLRNNLSVATLTFGYHAIRTPNRHNRGYINGNIFAFGDDSGTVQVWDIRRATSPMQKIPCSRYPITQTAFDQNCLVVSSKDHLLFFDMVSQA